MSDALGRAAGRATDTAGDGANPLAGIAQSEAAERLKEEVQEYLAAQATRLLAGVGSKLGEATVKLDDIAQGNSPGFAKLALDGGRKLAEGKGPVRSALEVGAGRVKETVMDRLKNLGGGGKGKRKGGGNKPIVIMESLDVGVPVRTAYDQWTQYQDFGTFAKGVKSANRADDTTSDWQAKIWWSSRSWKAHTVEQIPDYKIQWSSEGAKGSTKGVVSFHKLDENLTRVLLVIEYYPSGFFEKTGNIWRAQGRRVRLDFKNYARHITMKGEAEDSWRGEIRDGEVVRSHEDAVAEEEQEAEDAKNGEDAENAEDAEAEYEDEEPEEEGPEDEYDEDADAEDAEYEDDEGEPEAEYEDDEEPEDEDAYEEAGAEADEDEDVYEDEDDREPVGGSRR